MSALADPILPIFDLQSHHEKVEVPSEFDLRDLSRKYNVFPLKIVQHAGKRRLLLAMRNPFDHAAAVDVEFRSGMSVIPVQADDKDIQWLVQVHYYGRKLSPTPTDLDRGITHDVFTQLEMTTDAQKQPEWLRESLQPFYKADKK